MLRAGKALGEDLATDRVADFFGEEMVERRAGNADGLGRFGGAEGAVQMAVDVDERRADRRVRMGQRLRRGARNDADGRDENCSIVRLFDCWVVGLFDWMIVRLGE